MHFSGALSIIGNENESEPWLQTPCKTRSRDYTLLPLASSNIVDIGNDGSAPNILPVVCYHNDFTDCYLRIIWDYRGKDLIWI